eukprot:TRINITY_DN1153_c0_g1_i10.p3 TRINITY_DN1153_c0_g1~~TRINITY_DN1153_c0_g1_i10.p3  ORF type:complete len:134 (-),score=7.61 TRINITY_DN1153_c0_g1_i10:167-523(-)
MSLLKSFSGRYNSCEANLAHSPSFNDFSLHIGQEFSQESQQPTWTEPVRQTQLLQQQQQQQQVQNWKEPYQNFTLGENDNVKLAGKSYFAVQQQKREQYHQIQKYKEKYTYTDQTSKK